MNSYALILKFEEKKTEILYQGLSWYRKNLVDQIMITYNRIEIRFQRNTRIALEEYIFQPSNPVRYQLYRAACFYLSVVGKLPKVHSLIMCGNEKQYQIDIEKLTKNWKGCCVPITLPAEIAAECFSEEGKWVYIIITYFLKAQLDAFSHDCFRAAWSSLNAVYSHLSSNSQEQETVKLRRLACFLRNHHALDAEKNAAAFDKEFWKHLEWHNYAQKRKIENIKEDIMNNRYRDIEIYQCLVEYAKSQFKKDPVVVNEISEYAKERIKKKEIDANERVRFLVCEYCYMLRNRSFHALKPYPIFGLFTEDGKDQEGQLTRLLLLTIRDILTIGI